MRKQRRSGWRISLILLTIIACYTGWAIYRPLPAVVPTYQKNISVKAGRGTIAWPANGQAAITLQNSPTITTHSEQKPTPMASTAKVITALLILEKMPLKLGEAGPEITITDADVALYSQYVTQGGSVIPVRAGDKLSQYQALQAIMLPSANNMADSMAIRAYGSLDAYAKAANAYLRSKGIQDTKVGSDASGLAPNSTTTASDLVKIGKLAMANPVLASIVSQPIATGIPMTTEVRNVNFLLGTDGIVGIKTGTSDQAGGAFLGAAKKTVHGKEIIILSAVVGAPDRFSAVAPSRALLNSGGISFTSKNIVNKGQIMGIYKAPWGAEARAISTKDIPVVLWQSESAQASINLEPLQPAKTNAGSITVPGTTISSKLVGTLVLDKPIAPPSLKWRLMNPY